VKLLLVGVFALLFTLGGCATPKHGFSAEQIRVLKEQGFVQTEEGWENSLSDKVLFTTGNYELTPASRKSVQNIAKALLGVGIDRLRLDGHTDNVGSEEYNLDLSRKRAQAVADALVAAGMPAANLQVRGLGYSKPVVSNDTAEGRAENRRVAIVASSD
jgi:outer membrane protein OmpA-like peptidoglycan-associated protein